MLTGNYPEHDINQVFDTIQNVLSKGGVADHAMDEMSFLNRLFAALPVEAVEYGMQFLHGHRDLPSSCNEILPLYMRFVNLVEYCETIEKMREIPSNPTPEELSERIRMHASLDDLEKPFCTPLLGYSFRDPSAGKTAPAPAPSAAAAAKAETPDTSALAEKSKENADEEGSSNLHLMNDLAPVFVCKNAIETALFYEKNLGFAATHLDDEAMPHIRLHRDNISILLVQAEEGREIRPARELYGVPYDLFIYVSEPKMLELELSGAGVSIVKALDSDGSTTLNREFVFADNDGRHICVSHRA